MADAENPGKDSATEGTESHDPAYPPKFLEFMRKGWRDTELPVDLASRSAQLLEAALGGVGRVPRRDRW